MELLQKSGVNVTYPVNQSCCGQPMANSGFEHLSKRCNDHFIENFSSFDYIVGPSASCILHIKDHLHSDKDEERAADIRTKVYELVEFLTDVIKIETLDAFFPHKVGLHHSCHGLRGLHLSQMSELNAPPFSKASILIKYGKRIGTD
jgi:L-lactate dehydrogenase complex protein LldE